MGATKRDSSYYQLDAILERGLVAVSDLIDELAMTPPEDRDAKFHATNLTRCVEAVAKLKAEERMQLESSAKLGIKDTDPRLGVLEYLRRLPERERTSLWEDTIGS